MTPLEIFHSLVAYERILRVLRAQNTFNIALISPSNLLTIWASLLGAEAQITYLYGYSLCGLHFILQLSIATHMHKEMKPEGPWVSFSLPEAISFQFA